MGCHVRSPRIRGALAPAECQFRVMVKRARALLALKEYDEALKAVAAALKVNPTFGHALQTQADILKAQGKTAEAHEVRREGKRLEHARTSVASVKLR